MIAESTSNTMDDVTDKLSISKGTYHLFIGNLVSTLVLAITSIIVGRLLGPEGYGLYAVIMIIPAYVYLLFRWGISSTITRYSARYLSEGNEKKAISFSYSISILHLIAGVSGITLLIPFSNVISLNILHRPELSNNIVIPIVLTSVIGQIMLSNGNAAFVGLHEFKKAAIFQTLNASVKLVASVSLVVIGFSVFGAVAGYTLGMTSAGVISVVLLGIMNKSAIPRNIREDIRASIKFSAPIYFSQLATNVVIPFQNMILAFVVSNTEIGWYSAAVNISSLVGLFTYPLSTTLLPLFSKTTREGTGELTNSYRLSLKYTALFVTPVAMLLMILSTQLVTAVYGHAYQSAGNYVLVYAAVNLLGGLGSISWYSLLYGIGETRKAFLAIGAGSMVNIASSAILVIHIGVYGVILGTILGSIVSLGLGSRFVSKLIGLNQIIWSSWRIYFSTAITAILVYPLSYFILNSFLAILVIGILFLLLLIPVMSVTKALTRDDVNAMQDQFKDVKLVSYILGIVERYQCVFQKKHGHRHC